MTKATCERWAVVNPKDRIVIVAADAEDKGEEECHGYLQVRYCAAVHGRAQAFRDGYRVVKVRVTEI